MSTPLRTYKTAGQPKVSSYPDPNTEMSLTRFWGGDERGVCVQFTITSSGNYAQLTGAQLDDMIRVLQKVRKGKYPEETPERTIHEDGSYEKEVSVKIIKPKKVSKWVN